MLFEDIALIPALVTKCTHIGYVKKAFYNYYRRSNTISTSVIGKMVDITDAFRKFIDGSNPLYREEVVYCVAKQLMWNMTKSRIVFQANFIDLLNEYKSDFLLNSYIERDQEIKKLLQFMDKDIIPNNIICIDLKRELSEVVLNEIMSNFPEAKLIIIEKNIGFEDIPECVERAWEEGNIKFVEEYLSLRVLYEKGGIVLDKNTFPQLQLRKARLNKIFFGFENSERITTGCFGAQINHYVIKSILTSYEEDNIYNQALLPLAERIRDFLIIHFNLKVNGRKQLLKGEVQIYLPSVLAFDMKDQENYCKKYFANIPVGYEMIDEDTLRMWSSRIMENWNLYKQELAKKNKVVKKVEVKNTGYTEEYVQNIIHEVMNNYEKSTCWKITKPLRIISQIFRKEKVK